MTAISDNLAGNGLVGHSGFVGTLLKEQAAFSGLFNSANSEEMRGKAFDQLVVSGVPATMWLANKQPEKDRENILALFENLRRTEARRLVLISSIAVFADPASAPGEESEAFEEATPYGKHRRELEQLIEETFEAPLILRLPALFGRGLKKNFLFDLTNPVPSFLKPEAFEELQAASSEEESRLLDRYFLWDEAASMWRFERQAAASSGATAVVEAFCLRLERTALGFTNSASRFQFYNLDHLWRDIERALAAGLTRLNLASEPLEASLIAQRVRGEGFRNDGPAWQFQDMRSRHSGLWGRQDGYLYGAEETLAEIGAFYQGERERLG